MKRILAMLLSVICVLSFTCVSTYADEKSEDEEKAASIAESYLSAAAKNMWLYESNNLAEHTIQELVDTSGNSLLSDMSTDVNTQKILSSMDNICRKSILDSVTVKCIFLFRCHTTPPTSNFFKIRRYGGSRHRVRTFATLAFASGSLHCAQL